MFTAKKKKRAYKENSRVREGAVKCLCEMWAVIRICTQRKMTIVKTLYAT